MLLTLVPKKVNCRMYELENTAAVLYKKLLLNTPQLCCGDENSIAEGDNV